MNSIFKKLNYKNQPELVVLNAPDSFRAAMAEMTPLATMVTNPNYTFTDSRHRLSAQGRAR